MKIYSVTDLTGDTYLNPPNAMWDNGNHRRPLGAITHIAVHHDASVRPHDYDSVARYRQEAREHYARLGPGLQYHYKIDNVGDIFKIRPHELWLYAVGSEKNYNTINICLDGYFHPPYNQKPTREQYEALSQLIVSLCEEHPEFPATYPSVWPHRDFSSTACCGDTLVPYVHSIQDRASAQAIPSDAVYDWPSLQTMAPPPAPVPIPPPPAWKQDKNFKPAAYISQVNTHLDGLDTGKRYAEYPPAHRFEMVTRFTKGTDELLLTQYALDLHAQGKRELAGVPAKDLLLAQPSAEPTPPSTTPPPPAPTPPAPTPPPKDQDHEQRISALETIVSKIVAFLKGIFKWET